MAPPATTPPRDAAPPLRVACVAGFGSGISLATARRLGTSGGFAVALMARREDRLRRGEDELRAEGVVARGYVVDLADASAVRAGLARIQSDMGAPISVLHWNPYNSIRTPLLEMSPEEVEELNGVAVKGLLAAVQHLLPGWEAAAAARQEQQQQEQQPASGGSSSGAAAAAGAVTPATGRSTPTPPRPALLVTGGGLALPTTAAARAAVDWGVEGIAIAKAAQHKLVAVLREALAPRGVFVGQVTIDGVVKGTPWDSVRSSAEEEEQEAAAAAATAAGSSSGNGAGKEPSGGSGRQQPNDEGATGGDSSAPLAYFSADEVASALWRLYEAAPGGDEAWHVVLGGPQE